ncbi:hypothetical protein B0E46_11095 [Rhodanobacter sp. B04]|uniref:acyltransferase family protein n=1 Tax=Rhodanobacter sp. B04 TaxID=1945860 RepID=UPI0009D222F4|nr:acyltransferase [Rhodanobacter sp. B04]OOG62771.1 hypothetical protein B0E46_11095 [Rhodanobacter sp. B04]
MTHAPEQTDQSRYPGKLRILKSVKALDTGLRGKQDNFLLLRLLAAALVIYRHGGAVTGGSGFRDLLPWLGWGIDSGKLAVDMFFVVSGFMITGSYLRRKHLFDFLWARILRIFPAYLFCLVVSSFVLGAVYTNMPTSAYLKDPVVLNYVIQNIKLQTHMAWQLPGVFVDNPKLDTINGSIWTLPAEARMYLWAAALGLFGALSRRWLGSLVIAALLLLGIFLPNSAILMLPDIYLHIAAMFALGALCYLHRCIIPIGWPCVAVLGVTAYLLRDTAVYPYAFGITLAQFCFSFAYCTPWHGYNRFGDYSYGLYIWGFPMQQVIAHHFPTLPPLANSLMAFPLALSLGILSWHAIEKPALKLKRVPAQLWKKWATRYRWIQFIKRIA